MIKYDNSTRDINFSLLKLIKILNNNYFGCQITKFYLKFYPETDPPNAVIANFVGVGLGR